MKTTKIYKTKLGAKLAIAFAKFRNFFNGSHYVAETFTTRFNDETKEYSVEHFTMTRDEENKFHSAIAEQQAKIVEMIAAEAPTLQRQEKQKKWEADVERNRQKQLAENKSKKPTKAPAKPKAPKSDTPKMVANKPKRKYNKVKQTNGQ